MAGPDGLELLISSLESLEGAGAVYNQIWRCHLTSVPILCPAQVEKLDGSFSERFSCGLQGEPPASRRIRP